MSSLVYKNKEKKLMSTELLNNYNIQSLCVSFNDGLISFNIFEGAPSGESICIFGQEFIIIFKNSSLKKTNNSNV